MGGHEADCDVLAGKGVHGTGAGGDALGVLAAQQGLKIVVIEGEGAVNIIQQKTAVAPLVER